MKNLTCIPCQSSGKSRNTTLPKFIKESPKAKGYRPNDLSICPVPSSPWLKNGGPFFVGFLSGFHAFAGMTKKVLGKLIKPLVRPIPSSPSLKNGGPFTDCLSGFIENRKANISYKKDFYKTLVMEFSSCTCTSPKNNTKQIKET